MLGIIIGIAAVVSVVALGEGSRAAIRRCRRPTKEHHQGRLPSKRSFRAGYLATAGRPATGKRGHPAPSPDPWRASGRSCELSRKYAKFGPQPMLPVGWLQRAVSAALANGFGVDGCDCAGWRPSSARVRSRFPISGGRPAKSRSPRACGSGWPPAIPICDAPRLFARQVSAPRRARSSRQDKRNAAPPGAAFLFYGIPVTL